MRFGRVHDGLEQMSNRSSLAVEDVLDLFYDLCEDVLDRILAVLLGQLDLSLVIRLEVHLALRSPVVLLSLLHFFS